ncbi:dual specificity phosphatase [Cryomyces antarcticus]
MDSSSVTEPSPESSPDSPSSKPPPSGYTMGTLPSRASDDAEGVPPSAPFFELQRPTASAKRARNLKNLAVNTSNSFPFGRTLSSPSLPIDESSNTTTLSSPSFVKPATPPRRRPSNLGLTIMTPAYSKPAMEQVRLAIPPTPSLARPNTLRHFQSSPSLPLCSPSIAPEGGMRLPSFRNHRATKSSLAEIPSEQNEDDEDEQNFDVPQSREEKPEAYPNGPICIYDPHIDLYLEPTVEVAMKYDVIMNVASEVRNPFMAPSDSSAVPKLVLDGGGGLRYARSASSAPPRRPISSTIIGYVSGLFQESSPTTPKAKHSLQDTFDGSLPEKSSRSTPEYIHIPWEHNTDIVPDLYRLVQLIDDRVSNGKRILIHCQCGVSRSASLIVAYGLYKNPGMSVQEVYDSVKKRSKWIGPNMNLIMQLQEFRSNLLKYSGNPAANVNGIALPLRMDLNLSGVPNSEIYHHHGRSERVGDCMTPKTAPLPPHPNVQTHSASSNGEAIAPGPSSAPSGLSWPMDSSKTWSSGPNGHLLSTESTCLDSKGRVVPILDTTKEPEPARRDPPAPLHLDEKGSQTGSAPEPLASPRSAEFAMNPLHPSVGTDDPFGLLSPTVTEFKSSPFDRAALLGTLGMGSSSPHRARPPPRNIRHSVRAELGTHDITRSSLLTPSQPASNALHAPGEDQPRNLEAKDAPPQNHPDHSPVSIAPFASQCTELDGLMSPRATEFTENPFAPPPAIPSEASATQTPITGDEDPRSPAQKGGSPIIRSIFDVL